MFRNEQNLFFLRFDILIKLKKKQQQQQQKKQVLRLKDYVTQKFSRYLGVADIDQY